MARKSTARFRSSKRTQCSTSNKSRVCPSTTTRSPSRGSLTYNVSITPRHSSPPRKLTSAIGVVERIPPRKPTTSSYHPSRASATLKVSMPHWRTESIHRTKHPSRLNRDFGRKVLGDQGYTREELVAELGAAFLCAALEITPEVQEDHASYIAAWFDRSQERHSRNLPSRGFRATRRRLPPRPSTEAEGGRRIGGPSSGLTIAQISR